VKRKEKGQGDDDDDEKGDHNLTRMLTRTGQEN
jgi:hypothetical protein